MACGIYKITSPDNKVYIGSSNNIQRRYIEHRHKSSDSKLQQSFTNHGFDTHTFETVLLCSEEHKHLYERLLGAHYNSVEHGLNGSLPSYGELPAIVCEEYKRKISNSKIGKFCGEDNPNYGNKMSEENKKKLRILHLGSKLSEEHKQKISEKLKNRKHTEESKRKMSVAQSKENNPMWGKQLSEEHKAKLKDARKGKQPSIDPIIYIFQHPDHGVIQCSQYALKTRYGLSTNLSQVIKGRKKHCKQWTVQGVLS